MNIRTEFTEPECERFRRLCNFTADQRLIFDLRVQGNTVIEIYTILQDMNRPMSESTINRRIREIKNKIIKVI